MSSTSHGNLHVERYIGSCLISHNSRSGGQNKPMKQSYNYSTNYIFGPQDMMSQNYHHGTGNWTGMPLISVNNGNRNGNRNVSAAPHETCDFENSSHSSQASLSRLVMHAHGAPLILSSRYNNRRNNQCRVQTPNNRKYKNMDCVRQNDNAKLKDSPQCNNTASVQNIDSISVTSDESSGSAHSEACLPRIIKPRKRRKKDRKPLSPDIIPEREKLSQVSLETKSTKIVTLKPYAPMCYDLYDGKRTNISRHQTENNNNNYYLNYNTKCENQKTMGESSYESENKPLVISEVDDPKLHHEFDDLEDNELEKSAPSVCQCRYCDPSGQIWDVDQHCYSLFLTPPGDTVSRFFTHISEPDCVIKGTWNDSLFDKDYESVTDNEPFKLQISSLDNILSEDECDFLDSKASGVGVIGGGRSGVCNFSEFCGEWKSTSWAESTLFSLNYGGEETS